MTPVLEIGTDIDMTKEKKRYEEDWNIYSSKPFKIKLVFETGLDFETKNKCESEENGVSIELGETMRGISSDNTEINTIQRSIHNFHQNNYNSIMYRLFQTMFQKFMKIFLQR